MSKFGAEPAQNASHLSHFAARHVFGEMPQRTDTSLVRGIHARVRPLLLCCSPRALPTAGCRSGHTPQRLPHPSPPRLALSTQRLPERSPHSRRSSALRLAAQLQLLRRPAVLLLPPQGHGQGVATPSLVATIGRPEPRLLRLRFRFVSFRNRKKKGPRVRIRNNSGFQMRSQDSYEQCLWVIA